MPWQESPDRDKIIARLAAGETPSQVSKEFPRATVYRVYKEMMGSGQVTPPPTGATGSEVIDGAAQPDPLYSPPNIQLTRDFDAKNMRYEQPRSATATAERSSGADKVDIGKSGLDTSVVNRIRGILGISARPKVLSMPMPELLYPAMVIATTEMGFPPMTPDNFIDTVLYQWLEACDYIPYMYVKKSELAKTLANHGGITDEEIIKLVKERGITMPPLSNNIPQGGNGHDGSGRTEPNSPQNEDGGQRSSENKDQAGGDSGGQGSAGSPTI